ncbi:hypothetical protein C8F04DRAFT_1189667 [Mycena alexandri]|uniref:Uncharacterized protein n=1 Tax=Mycena alexandri TaxID=1745969 RepID=A0AAD6SI46_9AGAR|nr:hypothetical protein C8F04DRAFT_1189667 [Mycena alexandri]
MRMEMKMEIEIEKIPDKTTPAGATEIPAICTKHNAPEGYTLSLFLPPPSIWRDIVPIVDCAPFKQGNMAAKPDPYLSDGDGVNYMLLRRLHKDVEAYGRDKISLTELKDHTDIKLVRPPQANVPPQGTLGGPRGDMGDTSTLSEGTFYLVKVDRETSIPVNRGRVDKGRH